MMKTAKLGVAMVCIAVTLAGCAGRRGGTDMPPQPAGDGSASASGLGDNSAESGSPLGSAGAVGEGSGMTGPTEGLLGRRIVYFEYDSADIRGEDRAVVVAHAQYLSSNSGTRIRLEGHTDERGTREYNIGLAERRAQAVRRAMGLEGAREQQLQTVSFGEERPAVAGEDDVAYGQNRRVEIVYGN